MAPVVVIVMHVAQSREVKLLGLKWNKDIFAVVVSISEQSLKYSTEILSYFYLTWLLSFFHWNDFIHIKSVSFFRPCLYEFIFNLFLKNLNGNVADIPRSYTWLTTYSIWRMSIFRLLNTLLNWGKKFWQTKTSDLCWTIKDCILALIRAENQFFPSCFPQLFCSFCYCSLIFVILFHPLFLQWFSGTWLEN